MIRWPAEWSLDADASASGPAPTCWLRCGQHRQVLADLDAGRARGDRPELAADRRRARRASGRSCRAAPGRRRGRCRSRPWPWAPPAAASPGGRHRPQAGDVVHRPSIREIENCRGRSSGVRLLRGHRARSQVFWMSFGFQLHHAPEIYRAARARTSRLPSRRRRPHSLAFVVADTEGEVFGGDRRACAN